jgi:hypothetical protein
MKIVSVARELSTIEWHKEHSRFSKDTTGTKVTNPKTVPCWSLGEEGWFKYNNFFYDIQQYVSNDDFYDKLSSNKD